MTKKQTVAGVKLDSTPLLACPFCGEKAHSKKLTSGFIAGCYTTGCFAEVFEDDYVTLTWTTRRKAVEAWNHRANASGQIPPASGGNLDRLVGGSV